MKQRIVSIVTLILTLAALTFAGCAKPTTDSQKARYQRVKDRLDALGTKSPALREGIKVKVAEFDRDMKAAEAKGGAEAVKAMGEVASRTEAYELQLAPTTAAAPVDAAGPTPTPGGKLGDPAPPGGKLGDPAAPGGKLGDPAAPGGKLGDPAAPGGKLGDPTVPAPPPAGSSGFGGSAAPPAPTPAVPAPAAPGSGFGGQ